MLVEYCVETQMSEFPSTHTGPATVVGHVSIRDWSLGSTMSPQIPLVIDSR